MRCNIPKYKPLSITDYRKIQDAICNIHCCKLYTSNRVTDISVMDKKGKEYGDKKIF